MSDTPILLPSGVKPRKYFVTLQPNLETFRFEGTVEIDLQVSQPTTELRFHAEDLQITDASVLSSHGHLKLGEGKLAVKLQNLDGTATVKLLCHTLETGEAKLFLKFNGTLNDSMVGFYRASYMKNGEKKYMATTQFEATEARKALPCWDEPSLKATFEVTLIVPEGASALSNMPEVSRTKTGDGLEAVKFSESPIMSTYLLAFIVGDLEKISAVTREGVEVNVYATPGNVESGRFALGVATELISFFSDYFGIAYPLPKADLVAVPDFAMGAMENWGLITFRDTALLVGANSSAAACQRVAYVVSHELAHQWFGNLVTMAWWNDLWLNEGFATWVGWLGVDHVRPEWDVWTQFVSSDMGTALSTDALLSSHPIEVPIKDPKEIKQVFDALSYRKGACVVRQLDAAVTSPVFQKGLQAYLRDHQLGNTVTQDLWDAVSKASGKPVSSMMASWTQQMGYPLITVSEAPGTPSLSFRQSRFLSARSPVPEEDTQLWSVPLTTLVFDGEPRELPPVLLQAKDRVVEELRVGPLGPQAWVKVNSGQRGFYRVNYSAELWARLAGAVQRGEIGVTDRLGLLMDVFALAKAGTLRSSQALELAFSFKQETEYTVWSQLCSEWVELEYLLSEERQLADFEAVGRALFSAVVDSVGWTPRQGESHLTAMLRPLVIARLGALGHLPTVEEARRKFALVQEDPQSVPGDLLRTVLSLSVKFGGRTEFEAVKKLYRAATAPDFKLDCLIAMGQTRDPALVAEFLEFGLNEEEVKAQNVLYVFLVLSGNRHARLLQWEFVKENWGRIYSRFRNSAGIINLVVSFPVRSFNSLEVADEVEEFFEANPVPEAAMELKRSLEGVRSRAEWIARDLSDIAEWLRKTAETVAPL